MFKKILFSCCVLTMLTGCMGTGGLTGKVVKMNLDATDGPWGRECLFVGLWIIPVYPISGILDIVVFNTIEFWYGENIINGKSPLLDVPIADLAKMGFTQIESGQIERLSSTVAKLHLNLKNGDVATFDVLRDGKEITVSYQGIVFYRSTLQGTHKAM